MRGSIGRLSVFGLLLLRFSLPAWAGQANPPVSPSVIYERSHSSVVVIIAVDQDATPIAQGSGFIVGKDRIITNHHVIEDAAGALIVYPDGRSEIAEGVAADNSIHDLALLVARTGNRTALKLGDEQSVKQGDAVYALGAPRGLELSLTNGIVSGFRDFGGRFFIQATAPIAPGSSGGPLLDSQGRVIGVTTLGRSDSPGIYFSVGATDIVRLLRTPGIIVPFSPSGPGSKGPGGSAPNGSISQDPAEMPVSPAATADYKHQIEDAIAERGLTGRVKVTATASTLILTGKLHPSEHASLLKFMRNAPSEVRVVDDIQYDDSPVASAEQGDNGAHPIPAAGKSAIHIVTDVIGATATLYGPAGRTVSNCQTPCSFNNLAPNHYSLQIQKDGYLAVQIAVETQAGQALDQKIHLEALAKGLFVSSRPPGADVFIDGAKQSGQTPVALPLTGGQYDLVLRMPGYEAYSSRIQVKDNIQTTLDVELKQKQDLSRVAWAQVNSTPQGAEIFIDSNDTGEVTPARVQVPTGTHIISLHLKGYQTARHGIEVSDGGTVSVTDTLRHK
jgi:hypothetical protein